MKSTSEIVLLLGTILLVLLAHSSLAKEDDNEILSFNPEDVQKIEPVVVDSPSIDFSKKWKKRKKTNQFTELEDTGTTRLDGDDRCEIKIAVVGGTCLINKTKSKPTILLSFGGKQRRKSKHQQNSLSGTKLWTTFDSSMSTTTNYSDKIQHKLDTNEDLRGRVVKEFVNRFLRLMKKDYGEQMEPLIIKDVQFLKLKHIGQANIYGLKIYGFKTIEVLDTKLLATTANDADDIWKFNAHLLVANLTVSFQVNANLDEKLFINNWHLSLTIERCLFSTAFVLDFGRQEMGVTFFHIKSFENFRLGLQEPLTWPFNDVVSGLLNKEKYYLKHVIELNVQKFINLTIERRMDLKVLIDKILRRED